MSINEELQSAAGIETAGGKNRRCRDGQIHHAAGDTAIRAGYHYVICPGISKTHIIQCQRRACDHKPLIDHLADDVVPGVRNEKIPGSVCSHTKGSIQFRMGRRACVAGVAAAGGSRIVTVSRHRADDPIGPHLADDVVILIRNEQVAVGVNACAFGIIQFRIGRRAPVS